MNQVEQLQKELEKLQQEENQLMINVSKAESTVAEVQKKITQADSMQRAIEAKLIKISQLKSSKNKLEQTIEDVKIKFEELDSESLSNKLNALELEEDKIKKGIDDSEKELERQRKELDAITILRNKIKQQEEKNNSLMRRYAVINSKVDNQNEHNKS
jgi:chromosome segregation ATPase